jgi:hypothetical protein
MGGTKPATGDVSRGDDAERIVRAPVGRFGRIDVLANVAGTASCPSRTRPGFGSRRAGGWKALASYAVSRATRPTAKQAMRQVARRRHQGNPPRAAPRIAVPTALLWGSRDWLLPLPIAQAASATLGWPLQSDRRRRSPAPRRAAQRVPGCARGGNRGAVRVGRGRRGRCRGHERREAVASLPTGQEPHPWRARPVTRRGARVPGPDLVCARMGCGPGQPPCTPHMTVRLDSPSAAEQPRPGGRRLRAVLEGRHDGY